MASFNIRSQILGISELSEATVRRRHCVSLPETQAMRIAVLTSGGDSPGMNAAVRAVVRTGLGHGAEVFGVYEGLQGLVNDIIKPMTWEAVGGILQKGGTVLGTARSKEFRTPEGRRKAVLHLVQHGIDRLVVVGGDGSLTGALILHQEWQAHLKSLVSDGLLTQESAEAHPQVTIVGLPGSIDNDQVGSDATIGSDTALHRVVEAIDCIFSTAASHQRSFVIEVMGRNCGYLAVASALASGAEWVLIPECPLSPGWQQRMTKALARGRAAGRRASIVVVAEGARDCDGKPVTAALVRQTLEDELGEDARVTILGHVQRGGSPSAFDRILGTHLGSVAAEAALQRSGETNFVGLVGGRAKIQPLASAIERTQAVSGGIALGNEVATMKMRGGSFHKIFQVMETLVKASPKVSAAGEHSKRIAVIHGGSPAPGMNMAVRAAVRLLMERGHEVFGVKGGFRGLKQGEIEQLGWMSVSGWSSLGGAELGCHRDALQSRDLYQAARCLEENKIDGLLMIGGWRGYESVHTMMESAQDFPAFDIPMICLPASIDNNLPGSEFSIGADTALNSIVEAVDKIKRSAVAARRVFIVQVMGYQCGYLALMGGLATGAERVYLHEFGITAQKLLDDLHGLAEGFDRGKHLGLVIRNEKANHFYTTDFISDLFEEESRGRFDVRKSILGHLQQGGTPTPFDRIQAVRMAAQCVDYLEEEGAEAAFLGFEQNEYRIYPMDQFHRMSEREHLRPKKQWWLEAYRQLTLKMSSPTVLGG